MCKSSKRHVRDRIHSQPEPCLTCPRPARSGMGLGMLRQQWHKLAARAGLSQPPSLGAHPHLSSETALQVPPWGLLNVSAAGSAALPLTTDRERPSRQVSVPMPPLPLAGRGSGGAVICSQPGDSTVSPGGGQSWGRIRGESASGHLGHRTLTLGLHPATVTCD